LKPSIITEDIGIVEYGNAWKYQDELFARITDRKLKRREIPSLPLPENFLLLCEHPHVFTLGKSGDEKNLLANEEMLRAANATFFHTNRGGDITYHGPGQLVGYPLLDLDQFFTDIHRYLRCLEEVIICVLAEYRIKGERYPGYTGVWIDAAEPTKARKICAIGVRTSRWVTMHGWALNVNTELEYFNRIIPCGIGDKQVTSMNKELGKHVELKEVKRSVWKHFADVFECSVKQIDKARIDG